MCYKCVNYLHRLFLHLIEKPLFYKHNFFSRKLIKLNIL